MTFDHDPRSPVGAPESGEVQADAKAAGDPSRPPVRFRDLHRGRALTAEGVARRCGLAGAYLVQEAVEEGALPLPSRGSGFTAEWRERDLDDWFAAREVGDQ